jgi:hypothetical protein
MQPIKTFTFNQNIYECFSDLSLTNSFMVAGDNKGQILVHNLKKGEHLKTFKILEE